MRAEAKRQEDKIELTWQPVVKEGTVKVLLASDNKFKESGRPDSYKLIGEVPVSQGKFEVDLKKHASSDFYKVVLEGKYNTLNRWVVGK